MPPLARLLVTLGSLGVGGSVAAGPLRVDFSRSDDAGLAPLQTGWLGFGLPGTGGDEVAAPFADDELAGLGGSVAVALAGNSHARDYAPATGAFAADSALLSDGPLLNRAGVMTLTFSGLLPGSYALTTYHHTTQFGPSERPPATPFDVRLTDAAGDAVPVASGVAMSDNASPALSVVELEFVVDAAGAAHVDFVRGPDQGTPDHFALCGFELALAGPPPPPLVLGGAFLTEFMASNADTLTDGDGDAPDWVEIWNSTGAALDLSGWALSDDPAAPGLWRFPDGSVLQSDGYLVVFASGKGGGGYADPGGHLHTDFRIDRSAGGHLALHRPDGAGGWELVDSFAAYPEQREDVSYGQIGTELPLARGYFTAPTPGARNIGEPVAGFVADTKFSRDRGLYDAPFALAITTATPGAEIRYTLDGSEPAPDHGAVYSAPVAIDTTRIVRAAAFLAGHEPTNIDTHTYVFTAHVPDQPDQPPGFPTTWTGWDYGMDQNLTDLRAIVDDPAADEAAAKAAVAESLRALPTLSLVTDVDHLFSPATGIYHNTEGRGAAWERPCSIELIDPVDGGLLQIDCGVRLQGFTSRDPTRNPKHSLRLIFRRAYSAGKLDYPLFGGSAADRFDTVILRSNSQDAWVYNSAGNRAGQFVRDEWNRRTQLEMGRPSPHGTWVHLYLNGLYWGVYNPVERPDASFAASYFGGDKDDYDALKNHEEVIDGDGVGYNELLALIQNDPGNFGAGYRDFSSAAAYEALQGNAPDGTPDPALPSYLDVPNLIDYVIHNMYSAATDWPGNNYIARDRTAAGTGFKFFSWDNEHGMKPSAGIDRTQPHSRDNDSPTKFHHPLRANAEYRLRFADHLHRAFFNGGPLTADSAAARWIELTEEIRPALVAESARWGDYRRSDPYTVTGDFLPLREDLMTNWFPQRSAIVLGQFRAQGLYPDVTAPAFSQHGGTLPEGSPLGVTAPAGTIYLTLDGSDPRLRGGAVNPAAIALATGTVSETLLAAGASGWRYSDGGSAPPGAWASAGYDDSAWGAGAAPLGYGGVGDPDIATTIDSGPLASKHPAAYFRRTFTAAGAGAFTELALSLRRDDGAAVYLNGAEIVRSNLPAGALEFTTLALEGIGGTDEEAYLTFTVPLAPGLLVEGENTLAVEVHQSATSSSDLVLDLALAGTRSAGGASGVSLTASGSVKARALAGGEWSALNTADFIVGTPAGPGSLAVSEIHYKPLGGGALEFLELANISGATLELTGLRFTEGVEFEFPQGATLAPGERVLVVDRLAAFEAEYGPGLPVAGEFSGDLDNGGETITLTAADGATVRSFRYDDRAPWPESPDNGGFSLTLIAPASDPDHADPASWRSSRFPGGSPGGSDARPAPADPGDDGDRDGLAALAEFALGGDDADPAVRPALAVASLGDGTRVLSYVLDLAAESAGVTPEGADDLAGWTALALPWSGREDLGSGRVRISHELPADAPPFLRLRVDQR